MHVPKFDDSFDVIEQGWITMIPNICWKFAMLSLNINTDIKACAKYRHFADDISRYNFLILIQISWLFVPTSQMHDTSHNNGTFNDLAPKRWQARTSTV